MDIQQELRKVFEAPIKNSKKSIKKVFCIVGELQREQNIAQLEVIFGDLNTVYFEQALNNLAISVAFLMITNDPKKTVIKNRTKFYNSLYQELRLRYSEERAAKELKGLL